jgi:protein disulfide-isomerase
MVTMGMGLLSVSGFGFAKRLTAEMPWMARSSASSAAGSEISWHQNLAAGWKESRARNVPMVIFITSDRCHYCDLMKRDTWREPSVRSRLKDDFVLITLSPTRNSETLSRIEVTTYPTTLIGIPEGKVIGQRLGYQPPAALHGFLSESLSKPRP